MKVIKSSAAEREYNYLKISGKIDCLEMVSNGLSDLKVIIDSEIVDV